MEKIDAYLAQLSQFDVLLIDTLEAFLISAILSFLLFWLLRKVPLFQRLLLPGLQFRRTVRDLVNERMDKELPKDKDEMELVGKILISDAIRAAATIVAVVLIFSATLEATAPLVMS